MFAIQAHASAHSHCVTAALVLAVHSVRPRTPPCVLPDENRGAGRDEQPWYCLRASLTSGTYEVAQRSILPVRTDHHSKLQVCFEHLAGSTYTGEYPAYCKPTSHFCGQLKWAWGPEIVQAGTLQCLPAGEPGHCNAQCKYYDQHSKDEE